MSKQGWISVAILSRIEQQLPALLKSLQGWGSIAYDRPGMHIERLERVVGVYSVFLDRLTLMEDSAGGTQSQEPAFVERVLRGKMEVGICKPTPESHMLIAQFSVGPGTAYLIRNDTNVHFSLTTREVITIMVCQNPQLIDPNPLKPAKVAKLLATFRSYYPTAARVNANRKRVLGY